MYIIQLIFKSLDFNIRVKMIKIALILQNYQAYSFLNVHIMR